MKRVSFSIIIFLATIIFFSCSQEDSTAGEGPSNVEKVTENLLLGYGDLSEAEEGYIVLFLGYGYNEGLEKDTLLIQLDEKYGLAQNGGRIIPFVYPDDFISFGYERISLLVDNIEDALISINGTSDLTTIAALITLGAPDGTHIALANLQDLGHEIQVFSVFSQDDILGTEAGSTLVIDYSISQEEQQDGYDTLGEIDLSYPGNVIDVLSPLINAGLNWEKIHETGLFVPALRSEYSKTANCDFFVYVDPQTGLRAENHYVLTQKE